jgi:adenine phosphoribosyltransferase
MAGDQAGDLAEVEGLTDFIRDIPDFPTPGVLFRDITPLLADGDALARTVRALADRVVGPSGDRPDKVAGIEARGFVLGAAVATVLGVGFVPIRKPGKLPGQKTSVGYDLEYGQDGLEIHVDASEAGQRVVIVDDVLATGGTASAAAQLMASTGAAVTGLVFLIELVDLGGRRRLDGHRVEAILRY